MGIELSSAETIHNDLLQRIRQIWEAARGQAVRSVNTAHVCANWLIGQQIIQAEQGGTERAEYGTALLQNLSQQLTRDYGSGFSVSSLQYMRAFHINFPDLLTVEQLENVYAEHDSRDPSQRIQHAPRVTFPQIPGSQWKPGQLHPALSWTHYRTLLKVDRQDARNFYEIEAIKNGWSAGLILCTDKNDAVVHYVLGEDNQQIFASRYQFHLPSEEDLRAELTRELERLDPSSVLTRGENE